MNDAAGIFFALVFGTLFLVTGIMARWGRWKGWVDQYRDRQNSFLKRNFFFGAIPMGLAILLLIPIARCNSGSCQRRFELTIAVLFVSLLLAAFALMAHPPAWIKPAWLVKDERANWKNREPVTDVDLADTGEADEELPAWVRRDQRGRPRITRPDRIAGETLIFVKRVAQLRLTYQIRFLGAIAGESGGKIVLNVPRSCRFEPALEQFIKDSSGTIQRWTL
jgi:hypothetical protein